MSIVFPGIFGGQRAGRPLPLPLPRLPRAPANVPASDSPYTWTPCSSSRRAVTPGALSQPAGEAAVIDLPPPQEGLLSLQHRQGAPMGPGQLQHLFGSEAVRLRHVLSRPVHHPAVSLELRRRAGVGRPPITSGHTGISRCPSTSSRASSPQGLEAPSYRQGVPSRQALTKISTCLSPSPTSERARCALQRAPRSAVNGSNNISPKSGAAHPGPLFGSAPWRYCGW